MKILIEKYKIGIYCIENTLNNKKYIGSSVNIYNRILKHRSLLRNLKHENIILQNSWVKNKEESFICYVLEECNEEDLLHREQYWINKLNSYYNITKNVIRNNLSEESKIKISNTLKNGYKEGRIVSNSITPIDVYDLNYNLIYQFNSIKEASEELKISKSLIGRVLNGDYNKGKNMIFRYKDEKPVIINISKKGTLLYFNNNLEILEFKSFAEAARYFNVYPSTIHSSYKRKKSYKEYVISEELPSST